MCGFTEYNDSKYVRMREDDPYQFVNLIYLEMKHGIAERKAIHQAQTHNWTGERRRSDGFIILSALQGLLATLGSPPTPQRRAGLIPIGHPVSALDMES